MKISRVEARCLEVPVEIPLTGRKMNRGMLLVLVHTDDGISGIGIARDSEMFAARDLVNRELGPFLLGRDPIEIERIWNEAFWELGQYYRIRTGTIARAVSAVDQALWDIKGKYCQQPVYRLLGGAAGNSVEAYTTFGVNLLSTEQLVELAKQLVSQGHDKLKIQAVAANRAQDINEDANRVRLVREAVGENVRIMLDANSKYSFVNALKLAKRLEQLDLTFFDDPVLVKDVRLLADLRRQTTVPVASRAKGENIWDNREMIVNGAVDIMQENVLDGGGYTQVMKVAHMAEMYHLPMVTGGAFHLQNAHLIAGVANGWMTEYHLMIAEACETVFVDPPKPKNGRLPMPDKPGLGLELNEAAVKEFTAE